MILTFSEYGDGGGAKPVRYVLSSTKKDGSKRAFPPRVLEGDAKGTRQLIDACPHKWKYTSLVLSFTPEEYSDELARKVLDDFKAAAFPGLEPHQFDFLAVLHQDTANPHIHVLVPRMELTTRKSLNIAPPPPYAKKAEKKTSAKATPLYWSLWSVITRDKHDLKAINAPNPLDVQPFTKFERKHLNKASLKNFPLLQQKMKIHEILNENIASGLIENREDLINFLKGSGFEISRITEKSISLKSDKKNIRLEGGIYERPSAGDKISYREIAEQSREAANSYAANFRTELESIKNRFEAQHKSKFCRNARIYGKRKPEKSASYKKIFRKNERGAEEGKGRKYLDSARDSGAPNSSNSVYNFSKDLDALIAAASINNWNASAENSLETAQNLADLQFAKAMKSAEGMTPRYKP